MVNRLFCLDGWPSGRKMTGLGWGRDWFAQNLGGTVAPATSREGRYSTFGQSTCCPGDRTGSGGRCT